MNFILNLCFFHYVVFNSFLSAMLFACVFIIVDFSREL